MTAESATTPDSRIGSVFQSSRKAQGLTLAQAAAATRVRVQHLGAIEEGAIERLPAPVYARGYVRAYARYLGLDPEEMVGMLPAAADRPTVTPLHGSSPSRGIVLTVPVAAAVITALLATSGAMYAWRQLASVNSGGGNQPALHALALPTLTPLPSPSPAPKPIVVRVRATDTVWINVTVDGKPQYADSGLILHPGTELAFTGFDIKITSGKASATFITIDDRAIGALGNGVVTREFKAPLD